VHPATVKHQVRQDCEASTRTGRRTAHQGNISATVLPNLALWDQGAPPAAARSARRVGNVDRIHRGTAGCRSAHAGRPARRSPLARDGSATTSGANEDPSRNVTSLSVPSACHPDRPLDSPGDRLTPGRRHQGRFLRRVAGAISLRSSLDTDVPVLRIAGARERRRTGANEPTELVGWQSRRRATMARKHPTGPNQLAFWNRYDLQGPPAAWAISGPIRAVNHGQQRVGQPPSTPRSGAVASDRRRSSKLVMRVRFPSPAPPSPCRSHSVHREPRAPETPGRARYVPDHPAKSASPRLVFGLS